MSPRLALNSGSFSLSLQSEFIGKYHHIQLDCGFSWAFAVRGPSFLEI
jgi:hypothetical protein